ncbi:MAG: hypothetical protein ACFE0J_11930 [Elainellaceae cyanobacterium]
MAGKVLVIPALLDRMHRPYMISGRSHGLRPKGRSQLNSPVL